MAAMLLVYPKPLGTILGWPVATVFQILQLIWLADIGLWCLLYDAGTTIKKIID